MTILFQLNKPDARDSAGFGGDSAAARIDSGLDSSTEVLTHSVFRELNCRLSRILESKAQIYAKIVKIG